MDNKKKETFAGSETECANCTATKSKAGQPLSQKCSRCQLLSYCSRDCQVQHWKSGGHQKWCLTPKERSVQQLAKKEEPEATPGLNGEGMSCPVCLEPMVLAKADLNVTLACLHVFHTSCIEGLRSYAFQQACPLCRAELPPQADASTTKHCDNCGAEECPDGTPLVNCANCKLVLYCGRDCQREHWKNGGHKTICTQATAQRIAAALNKPLDSHGTTQLMVAVMSKQAAKVRQLIDQGAKVDQARDDGTFPLFMAACEGHAKVARLLIEGGAAVNQTTTDGTIDGTTSLHVAAQNGYAEVVSLLISGGAAVNQATINRAATPLFLSAHYGHSEVVRLLIEGGAPVNPATTDDGTTPLIAAAREGHVEVVRLLIEGGAAVNQVRTDDGITPLFAAAWQGHAKVVRLLIEGGAAVNQARKDDGTSPLYIAAFEGHAKVVRLLIEGGAEVNQIRTDNATTTTQLHAATQQGHTEVVSLLIEGGAAAAANQVKT